MKVTFIIPAYNEEDNIAAVIKALSGRFPDAEIVVVDDASTDRTFQEAKESGLCTAIRHRKNRGYGAALKTGILSASGEFVVFVDGDGQHPLDEIQKVVNVLHEDAEVDAVLTRRRNIYSSGPIRGIGKVMINYVTRSLANENIQDSNSGLRAFRRSKIRPFLFMMPEGFSFSTTSTILAYKEDFLLRWIDIDMAVRKGGKSQVRVKHGINTMLLVIRLIVIFDPLRFFLPLSGYAFVLGILSIIASILTSQTIGKNYIFFLLFGMLSFILGLLSEQISTLRKEVSIMKAKDEG